MDFFDYFQIASLVVFLVILIGKILYLRLRRNVNPIAIGGGKKGFRLAFELLSFGGLGVWVVELLLYAFHSRFRIFRSPLDMPLVSSPTAKLVGVIVVSLGLVVFASAYFSFGDSWRVGFDVKNPGTLVTKGIFSVSRNPIYLFLDLWFVGIFLINGTLIFLIFALLAVAAMHFQIRQEEAFLSNLYGQPYRDYCARTGRYITVAVRG
ncbi:MAG TPA: isoprenylcysteine carboxylmethyltransferase family protein [Pyrinomonadaceae bacterium]|nr:isoprenylcysteine carboxylmethyltransferase family protein [Pyrinomonadaceae bacterium]